MMEITELEKAYIAGFFDGEGSVIVRAAIHNNIINYELIISIGQNDTSVLRYIQQIFGGRIANPKYEFTRKKQTPDLRMEASKASFFLEMILPYLKVKRKQAELAIAFQKLIFPKGKCKKVDQYTWDKRKELHDAVKILNRSKCKKLDEVEAFNIN